MKIQTSVRINEEFYKEARDIFQKLGLSFGEAVNLFLAKVVMEKGIPFELKIPSKEVEKRISNLEKNKNVKIYNSSKELFDDLGI
jgi:DNA-damage-inducible protein J